MNEESLCLATARELARGIREKRFTAVEVMRAHLARIEHNDPVLNAIPTLLPERALDAARAADDAVSRGDALGPLHGLPIAHKDLAPTRGIRTTQGSKLFANHVPETDALFVERIRDAGAICIGKTNVPEFGAGSQTFNEVFGPTRNPWDPSRTCGGSSGGAAVALAAGMLPIADGSDFGGSLRNPASFCNVVGFRSTPGRIPRHPAELGWASLGVEGPMARNVADTALLFSVMAGPDARSPIALETPGSRFAEPLDRDFHGVRVAWSEDLGGLPLDPRVREALRGGRAVLESIGCRVVDASPDLSEAAESFDVLRASQFALAFADLPEAVLEQTKDTVQWNVRHGQGLSAEDVGRAELARTRVFHRMREFLDRHAFLALPVSQVPPFPVETEWVREIDGTKMETYIDWMKSCSIITTTGCPAISVPCGFTAEGLPVGLQLVARHRDDFGLLQLAHAFESACAAGNRRPPAQSPAAEASSR